MYISFVVNMYHFLSLSHVDTNIIPSTTYKRKLGGGLCVNKVWLSDYAQMIEGSLC